MNTKQPNHVDIEVGRRIRTHRIDKKLSQTALGDALGVTFQQVQKYEKGTNRCGPSRLQKIADTLGVPITAFFASADGKPKNGNGTFDYSLVQSRTDLATMRNYASLKPTIQRRVAALLDELAACPENRQDQGRRRNA